MAIPWLAILMAIALPACDDDPTAVDGAVPDAQTADSGADSLPPVPSQVCRNGLVSTHLPDPDIVSAMSAGLQLQPGLPLASGDRILPHTVSPELALRVKQAGELALAYLPHWPSWTALATLGVRPVEHLADYYYIVALERGASLTAALQSGLLLGVGLLRPADKLPPSLAADRQRTGRKALFADANGRRWERSFAQLGLPLTRDGERRAAAMPWVYRVARERAGSVPLLEETRQSLKTETLQGFSLKNNLPTYSGLTGKGVTAIVYDYGVDAKQLDMFAYDDKGNSVATRVEGDTPMGTPPSPHGTAVASMLAGWGTNSEAYVYNGVKGTPYQWRGHAPGVSKIVSVLLSRGLAYTGQVFAQTGAHLSNHSVSGDWAGYASMSKLIDEMIHQGVTYNKVTHPARPMVWSGGNTGLKPLPQSPEINNVGYYALSAQAKNSLMVGAINANDDTLASRSSRGPTYDGRIKPDIVAPGYKTGVPPTGVWYEIDQIALRAKASSGASDVVWDFEKDGDLEGWKPSSRWSKVTVKGGKLRMVTYMQPMPASDAQIYQETGGFPLMVNDQLSLKADDYDTLELKLRIDKGTSGKYRISTTHGCGWDNDTDPALDAAVVPTDTIETDKLTTTSLNLPTSTFTGTVTRLYITDLPLGYDLGPQIVTDQTDTQSYTTFGGTSFSAPTVAGALALLMQQYKDSGVDIDKQPPLPSTYKGLLIHTAVDMIHKTAEDRDRNNPDTGAPTLFHEGPDFATGWGRADAQAASTLVAADDAKSARKVVEQSISTGNTHTYRVPIDASVKALGLKATLVWDDAPGSPTLAVDARRLVNDLDLVAVSPSGKKHGPWLLDPLPFNPNTYKTGKDPIKPSDVVAARRCVGGDYKTKTCRDDRNNVEQVELATPEAGWWTIQVSGFKVPQGPQKYSLIVSASCP
jgi:hypothetical protein